MMEKINDSLSSMFPCLFCWIIGYILCPFTFGLSLCIPFQCIKDAEETLRHRITRNNRNLLSNRGVSMVLIKRRCTSWIELKLNKESQDEKESSPLI